MEQGRQDEHHCTADQLPGSGESSPGLGETSEQDSAPVSAEPYEQTLQRFLKTEFNFPGIDIYIERQLKKAGVLSVLEEAGVLPVVDNPNPFDLSQDETASEQWWEEHPEQSDTFFQGLKEREQILKYIHIGILVERTSGHRLYQGRDMPTSSNEYQTTTATNQ